MSSSGVFGPPPPGVDLSETQNAAVIRAVVSLMAIGTVAVILRFVAQFMRDGKQLLSWDDYLIIPALVSGYQIPQMKTTYLLINQVLAHGTAVCSLVSEYELPNTGLWK